MSTTLKLWLSFNKNNTWLPKETADDYSHTEMHTYFPNKGNFKWQVMISHWWYQLRFPENYGVYRLIHTLILNNSCQKGVQALIASVESQLLMKVCAVMPRLVLRLWIHCHFKNVVRVRVICFQSTGVIKKNHWPALKRRAECHQPSPLNVSKD